MEIKNIYDAVIFTSAALTIKDAIIEAVNAKTNLYGANLRDANLRDADLYGADLRDAYLNGANLRGADLYGANLRGADLYGANLRGADLSGADLSGADLSGADLYDANLRDADLRDAYLNGANLYGANLSGANLRGADLYDANLRDADLRGKKIHALRVFTGLYDYEVWSVVFEDGSRHVKMGCLLYSLEKWDKITIRKSNLSEFPDDGSDKCEDRVAAFEFAKAAVLRMKAPNPKPESVTA